MKFGARKPNIKKSVRAKTTGSVKREIKSSVNPIYGQKGTGFAKNPKKAIDNSIYHKTTFDTLKPVKDEFSDKNQSSKVSSNNKDDDNYFYNEETGFSSDTIDELEEIIAKNKQNKKSEAKEPQKINLSEGDKKKVKRIFIYMLVFIIGIVFGSIGNSSPTDQNKINNLTTELTSKNLVISNYENKINSVQDEKQKIQNEAEEQKANYENQIEQYKKNETTQEVSKANTNTPAVPVSSTPSTSTSNSAKSTTQNNSNSNRTVYITSTGKKYHLAGCRTMKKRNNCYKFR